KNLQRVRAEPVSKLQRPHNIPRDRRMDSDADASVFPGGNFRGWGRFGAVLVGSGGRQGIFLVFVRPSLTVGQSFADYFIGFARSVQTTNSALGKLPDSGFAPVQSPKGPSVKLAQARQLPAQGRQLLPQVRQLRWRPLLGSLSMAFISVWMLYFVAQ